MNKRERILTALRTKASHLGYSVTELGSVAELLGNNPQLTEEATEEAINAQIEAVIPFLKVGQQQASRLLANAQQGRDKQEQTGGGLDSQARASSAGYGQSSQHTATAPQPRHESASQPRHEEQEAPLWFRRYQEEQEARFRRIEGERVTSERRKQVESLLGAGAGVFGRLALREFEGQHFETQESFDSYLSSLGEDLKAYHEEQATGGARTLSASPGNAGDGSHGLATETELQDLVAGL